MTDIENCGVVNDSAVQVEGLVDKRSIFEVLGCLMQKPDLLDDYKLEVKDFEVENSNGFYECIFAAINNCFQHGVQRVDYVAIDSMLSNYDKQYEVFNFNDGANYCNQAIEIAELDNFDFYYGRVRKFALLRHLEKKKIDTKFIYDISYSDPIKQESELNKLDSMTLADIINQVEGYTVADLTEHFGTSVFSRGQQAGKGLRKLKEKLKQAPEIGLPLQSDMMSTIARGARLRKMYLRSSNSGGGKSRTAMGDALTFSVPTRYNTHKKEWITRGFSSPCLYISVELDIDELQTLAMAYISGVNEEHILDGNYVGDEEERVDKAIDLIENSPIYFEVIPNFGIEDIVKLIKKYKRVYNCQYFIFDYIHMSVKLIEELSVVTNGARLREDQLLFLFVDTLKNLCNQLHIFLLAMTQLNGSYKDSPIKDETMLRGAKNMADRVDLGEISLPPSKKELEAVAPIMSSEHMINTPRPNLIRHVYKARKGRLAHVKVWQYVDLGTCETVDLFITNNDNEIINNVKILEIVFGAEDNDDEVVDEVLETVEEKTDDTEIAVTDYDIDNSEESGDTISDPVYSDSDTDDNSDSVPEKNNRVGVWF